LRSELWCIKINKFLIHELVRNMLQLSVSLRIETGVCNSLHKLSYYFHHIIKTLQIFTRCFLVIYPMLP